MPPPEQRRRSARGRRPEGDDVGSDLRAFDDGGAGVVAGRLQSQNLPLLLHHLTGFAPSALASPLPRSIYVREAGSAASSHMIRASSPLSW